MKARAWHLLFLCRCLSPIPDPRDTESLAETIRGGSVSWELLATLAGIHLVTPTLRHALHGKGLTDRVPDDFRQFLDVVYQANLERNQSLRSQARSAIRLLNSVGVEPIPLKGVVGLLTGNEEGLGSRMMADIDFLIHPDAIELSREKLVSEGYYSEVQESEFAGWHHSAPLSHRNERAPIELHRALYGETEPAWVENEELWVGATRERPDGLRFRLLSPHHEIAYNVFHSEVHHNRGITGRLGLRDLLDLTRASLEPGVNIDWTYVRETFYRLGLSHVLDAYLYKAYRLFGLSTPATRKPSWSARRAFKRSLSAKPWEELSARGKALENLRLLFSAQRLQARFGCSHRWTDLAWYRLVYGTHLVKKFLLGERRSMLVDLLSSGEVERREIMGDYDAKRSGS